MRPRVRIYNSIVLLFCLSWQVATAQQSSYKYQSKLTDVKKTGYHRINLTPLFTARAKEDLADVRLVDDNGNFVPYLKPDDLPSGNRSRYTELPVASNIIPKTDTSTIFAVQNNTGAPINKLWLTLRNTSATRKVTVTGSDDAQNWFAVAEDLPLEPGNADNEKSSYRQVVAFPASNYRYLKLTVENKRKSPINILSAGIYSMQPEAPRYVPLKLLRFKVADSPGHVSHIYVSFEMPHFVDKIRVSVAGDVDFRREMNIYTNDDTHRWLTSKVLSNNDSVINLSVKTKSFDIQISDHDDHPLHIAAVGAYQHERYLIAKLSADKDYHLILGDPKATTPNYDLKYFSQKFTGHLPEVTHKLMSHNTLFKRTHVAPENKKKYWLWVAVIAAIGVLSALTYSMMGEMKKREAGK